jgi:hypothetical protein
MLSSMYSSSMRSSNRLADQRSALVPWTAARTASGRMSRRQRLSAACVARFVRADAGFVPVRAEETRRALRLRGAGIVTTLGEAAGENLHFIASAIPQTRGGGWICASFLRARGSSRRDRGIRYPERNWNGKRLHARNRRGRRYGFDGEPGRRQRRLPCR